MTDVLIRDCIDCGVKVWMIFFFSRDMEKEEKHSWQKWLSLGMLICFVLMQRYVLSKGTLNEAFARNIMLYLLTCGVMLTWRKGQKQYLIFLASIVFFLEGGWLKLFTPSVFATLHLPTFGYAMGEAFPFVPITIGENVCRIVATVLLKRYAFDISPDREISGWEAALALLPALIDHTTVLIIYHLTTVNPSWQASQISVEMTLLTLLLVFGMPLMLVATEQRFQLQRKELALLRMEHQMKAQVKEFESRKLSDAHARRIYHDLAKQLSVLEGMAGDKEKGQAGAAYLQEMIGETEGIAPHTHTGNTVLDTLLSQKGTECSEKGITLECMVDFKDADFIRYADIVTMFSNALDNAIEAVEKLAPEKRWITLSSGKIGGHLIVKCSNPYEGARSRNRDGLFVTSKADQELHGIGLSNVKRIVESYDGVLQIEDDGETFLLEWMIPLPDAV